MTEQQNLIPDAISKLANGKKNKIISKYKNRRDVLGVDMMQYKQSQSKSICEEKKDMQICIIDKQMLKASQKKRN